MKYAALIFGDDDRQPKKAADKLSFPEPGQIVRVIDGSAYRVASKIAGPDGVVVKLANLQGQPVQTPPNFRPVGTAISRFASWLKYHLAYNKDFDLYVNAYIERYNQQHKKNPLPYPVGRDGKAFRWANWFQTSISPKLYIPGRGDVEDQQAIKDELIHEMLFTVLGKRNVLDQFVAKAKSLGVNRQNAARKLTDFLISAFSFAAREEVRRRVNEQTPKGEVSLSQPQWTGTDYRETEGEHNILDTEEHAYHDEEFQSAEARHDVAKFRESFRKWLMGVAGKKGGENFILMFDIFWRLLQREGSSHEDAKRSELQREWMEKTGLSFGSFKDYFTRLPNMVEDFIMSHGTELGDKNIFVELMTAIRAYREKRERKERRQREHARPAMVSSLNVAGVEEEKQAGGVKRLYEDEMERREKEGLCPECGGADIDRSATLGCKARCNECKHEFPKTAGGVKRMYEDEMIRREELLASIRPGDRVTIMVPAGMGREGQEYAERTGRAVIVSPGRVALNMGGQHGTPGVATVDNIVSVRHAKSGSVKIAQKLVRGDQLTPEMRKQVLDAFIYRWTYENKRRGDVYHCDKCDVRQNPYVNEQSAEGHQHPTIPLQHDEQWLSQHAFYFTNAGKLLPRMHAQPAYLAPQEPITASVAQKFAVEKSAYNPGMAEYIYRADVYCERCANEIKKELSLSGNVPESLDETQYDSDAYPKGPYYNQESDGPEHCARCGKFLENPLTTEGYRYLNEMILEADEQGRGDDEVIQEWKAFYPEREQFAK